MKGEGIAAGCVWAVAYRPLPGETVSGDGYMVEAFAEGLLLGVIDGLGHGAEAADAAGIAAETLKGSQPWQGLEGALQACHTALRGSRGVVLTLAFYRPAAGLLQWSSIGNVEGVLWHRPGQPEAQRLCVIPRGGVLGYQIPTPQVATVAVADGDLLCLATDGIASAFVEKTPATLEPRTLADYILKRYGQDKDDALILAVRLGRA